MSSVITSREFQHLWHSLIEIANYDYPFNPTVNNSYIGLRKVFVMINDITEGQLEFNSSTMECFFRSQLIGMVIPEIEANQRKRITNIFIDHRRKREDLLGMETLETISLYILLNLTLEALGNMKERIERYELLSA